MWVYCLPVAGDSIEGTIIAAEGNVETDNRLARLDIVQVLLVNAGLGSSRVVEKLNLFEETGLTVFIETRASRSGDITSGESTA